jgi:hypothetical protein
VRYMAVKLSHHRRGREKAEIPRSRKKRMEPF